MAVTPQEETGVPPSPRQGLTMRQMLRYGSRGLYSDIRDRRREPALRKRPTARALDPRLHRPIFIVGAPRSGTTFLGSCIGRLPEVSYHFEPRLTNAMAQCVFEGSWSERRSELMYRFTYSTLVLAGLHGGRRFSEKTPENSFIVPFLAKMYPDAQFIHIIRDGRDAAVSHAERPWLAAASAGSGRAGRAGQPWGPNPRWWVEDERRGEFSKVSDIARSAWCWRRFTQAALDGVGALPQQRVIEVRYESVVTDPMGNASTLGEFLGASPAGLEALRAGFGKAKPSSVGRWRKSLDADQLADVEREIGPLLSQLGYA